MLILSTSFQFHNFICNVCMCSFSVFFHVSIIKTPCSSPNPRAGEGLLVLIRFAEDINMLQDHHRSIHRRLCKILISIRREPKN